MPGARSVPSKEVGQEAGVGPWLAERFLDLPSALGPAVSTYEIGGCILRLETTERGAALQAGPMEAFRAFETDVGRKPDVVLRILPEDEVRGPIPEPPPDLGPRGRLHDGQGGRRLWTSLYYMEVMPGGPMVAWAVQRDELPVLSVLAAEALSTHLDESESGVLLHASGIARPEGAVVLAGRGGAGKSTAVRLRPAGTWPLGDECIVVRRTGDGWLACATPLGGDAERRPDCVPLLGIGILTPGEGVALEALSLVDVLAGLAACTFRPGRNVLSVLARLADEVPVRRVVRGQGDGFWSLVASWVGWTI